MAETNNISADNRETNKRREAQRARSRQLSVTLASLTAVTALVTTVGFIVVTAGKRYEGSELLPFAAAAVIAALVFATFLKLVNEEPSLLYKTFRSILIPSFRYNRGGSDDVARQLLILHRMKAQKEKAAVVEEKVIDVEQLIRRSLARLEAEISEVRRRGGINLAMGMSITLIGLGILGYAVYAAPPVQSSPSELAAYFLPRLSLALVTEMFAYFFLRLYKISMTETKYFQNELTGAEARALSILMSSSQDSATLVASVAKSLAGLDRNHVLERGQTTVEIEQARVEAESMRGLTAAMTQPRRWGRATKGGPAITPGQ